MTDLPLHQFQYELPDERIARYPLPQRDGSKLLLYRHGEIAHRRFFEMPDLLPAGSMLVFNDTKVIPARLRFRKSTGAIIELFLLSPLGSSADGTNEPRLLTEAVQDRGRSRWACMIGNRKRWKPGEALQQQFSINDRLVTLTARRREDDPNPTHVYFEWTPADEPFAVLLQAAGSIPLPPYLKREAVDADRQTYQTVYSKTEGAVAAPTAGLHFTPEVLSQLTEKGIKTDYLTLHVGAGTFQPIKTENVRAHLMHTEQVVYTRTNLERLAAHGGPVIPVGTTSLRSLESLYWFGLRVFRNEPEPFYLDQQYAYSFPEADLPGLAEVLGALLNYLRQTGEERIVAQTGIYIMPGYRFRLCRGLITNFHQPGSTLIVLVSALIGEDWKRVYHAAMENEYRFLSYGDSSLLLP